MKSFIISIILISMIFTFTLADSIVNQCSQNKDCDGILNANNTTSCCTMTCDYYGSTASYTNCTDPSLNG